MKTFISAAGYEMGIPGSDDLDDFSIHEPSIGPGESVGGLDEFIAAKQFDIPCQTDDVVDVRDLREFMKGRAVVSWLSLRIAHDCFEDFIRDYSKTPTDDPETRKRLMQSYDNALQDIRTALRPTSSGDQP